MFRCGITAFTRNRTRLRDLHGQREGGRKAGARGVAGQRHVEQRSLYPAKFRRPLSARSQGVTDTH